MIIQFNCHIPSVHFVTFLNTNKRIFVLAMKVRVGIYHYDALNFLKVNRVKEKG